MEDNDGEVFDPSMHKFICQACECEHMVTVRPDGSIAIVNWYAPGKKNVIRDIINLATAHYRVTYADVMGERRTLAVANARKLGMWLIREVTKRSYPEVARTFNRTDHCTSWTAWKRIEEKRRKDREFNKLVIHLRDKAHKLNRART